MCTGIQEANFICTQGVELPLLLATYIGNRRIVQLLIKYRAEIYERDEVSRYLFKTPPNTIFLQNGVAAYEVAEMAKFRDLSDTLNPEQVYIIYTPSCM